MKQFWILSFFISLCTLSIAEAGTRFSLLYAPNYNLPQPRSDQGGVSLASGGALLEFGNRVGFEFGAFYQTLLLNGTATSNVDVPVSIRFWLGRFITLSAGGFGRYRLSPNIANRNALDYGVRGTFGFNIPVKGKLNLVIEAGTEYGLATLSTVGARASSMNGFLLLGIRIGEIGK